ncbi:UDP-N-acetylglucosamine 1-carboxyvinyltransferase [Candidatus Azambacteria bacterium]|nr:UDP-N-acetylglucosamine 1-carboxyvinyltransferase [Candidatus Azambacteria bacterium]MBI3685193.1 UDP-N-acetylglucosamine 1-carboxyvinyltransferase [Candidatus Azambacteria bacterium]
MPSKEKFIITGGKKLEGDIKVRGAKNAAFAVLAATLLTDQECEIDNLPLVGDVMVMLDILKKIGVRHRFVGKRKIVIQAKKLYPGRMPHELVEKIRASILLWGALPSRVKRFVMYKPGGCSIGARILDPHVEALGSAGIISKQKNGYLEILRKDSISLRREVVLSEMSVTATENVILASVTRKGVTEVFCATLEPHVQDMCHMLNKMGAEISGIGTNTLVIRGVEKLKGVSHTIIPDPIEMGTFIALAAATKSHLTIRNCVPEFIKFDMLKFKEAHVTLKVKNEKTAQFGWGYRTADIEVFPSHLKAVKKVHNLPYPGLCPDVLPMFAVLATQAKGVTLIHDWMYEGRLKYIDELKRMGADAFICDPHRALITGPTPLEGKEITSFDLRAGAVLLIAALCAKGETIIYNAHQVDRGYESIEARLRKIGAVITRAA